MIKNVRIPSITSIETAVRLYYEKSELSNSDVKQLFGNHSSATISKLKNLVRERVAAEDIPVWNAQNVPTKTAYEVWGLDIGDLEHRLEKLNRLKKLTAV